MTSSSKYASILEIGLAMLGITFAANLEEQPAKVDPARVAVKAQAPESGDMPNQQITVNAPQPVNNFANSFIVVCTCIATGITLIGMRINDWIKDYRMKNADTPQGKLTVCEERLQDFMESQKERDAHAKEAMSRMADDMASLQRSNEMLNKTIASQLETIAKLSAPVVVTTSSPPNLNPALQTHQES